MNRHKQINNKLHDIKTHKERYFVTNAIIYNTIASVIALAVIIHYITLSHRNPMLPAILTGAAIGLTVAALVWFFMLYIPYITIGKNCLSYKVAPARFRKFLDFKDITAYSTSFLFFTIHYTNEKGASKKLKMWLYGVRHKNHMIKSLSAKLDQVIAENKK